MSTPSHPSPPSPSSSPSIPRVSEGKDDGHDDEEEEERQNNVSTSSESSQWQSQLDAKEEENEGLRRELAAYRARFREDEKEERRRVIGHRVSFSAQRDLHGVTIINESLPPLQSQLESSPIRSPGLVPHRNGRLTLSPPPSSIPLTRLSKPETPVDQGEAGDLEVVMTQKQREGLIKTMVAPPSFSGDKSVDKTADVRDWVEEAEKWLHIHVGPDVNKGLLPFVEGILRGGAASWMTAQRKQLAVDLKARGMKGVVEWHEVREGFIEQFEGPQYRALIREELKALKLWKGKCKSIPLFNSEFDRLSRRLYPNGQDLAAFIPVLAEEYGNCLRHSDEDLWCRAVAITIPASLTEWRERTVSCFATREILKAQKSSWTAAAPPSKSTSSSLAQLSTEGEREEGQTDVSLNAFQPGKGPASKFQGGGTKGKSPGEVFKTENFLTEEEFTTLWKQGKCFICFLKGHLSGRCPKRKETRRHPTAEELKA
jgi:hypothetical protein